MTSARTVRLAALVAVLARIPGALWPIRPDEAGFTLVARAWDPQPDAMYGRYWVDRPPPLLALVRLTDALAGPLAIRLVGALGCGLLVLAAAALARQVAAYAGRPEHGPRMAAWTAVGTTAVTSNAMIDLVAVKGEVLALPLLVGTFWLALRGLLERSARLVGLAGLTAGLALGLKQNLLEGVAFTGLLLVVEWLAGGLPRRTLLRLGGAFALGLAVPVGVTVGWAVAAGVRLGTLWYAVYGFRSDAWGVIWSQPAGAPLHRARVLAVIFVLSGLALVYGWFLVQLPRLARARPALATATAGVVALDLAGVVLGGSYWRPYLFGLVPGCVLVLTLLTSETAGGLRLRRLAGAAARTVAVLVTSSAVALSGWFVTYARNAEPPTEVRTGEAVGGASAPTDTLVVYGGRADLQLSSGLSSPYPHLWSLPARTLDPGARRLARLLDGRRAPTWFVEWVSLDAWDPAVARRIRPILERRYDKHGSACDGRRVYLRRGLVRADLQLDCDRPAWLDRLRHQDRPGPPGGGALRSP